MGCSEFHQRSLWFLSVARWRRCVTFVFVIVFLQVAYFSVKITVMQQKQTNGSPGRLYRLLEHLGIKRDERRIAAMAAKDGVAGVRCSQFFDGSNFDVTGPKGQMFKVQRVKDMMAFHRLNKTNSCATFQRVRGYFMHYGSLEEKEFPIAYSILIYKEFYQVERLIRAIYRPQNYYCIHYDGKSSNEFRQNVHKLASCFENIFVSSEIIRVRWGTFSVLKADLLCMKDLLTKPRWKYFINLTGQEFPLKTNWQIVRILRAYGGANDVQATIRRRNVKRTQFKEPAPHNITLVKGPVHAIMSRRFVAFIFTNQKALDFLKWTQGTWIPDETFFSTLQHNPHLGVPGAWNGSRHELEIKPSMARYKLWRRHSCEGKRVRQICIFSEHDLPRMKDAPQLFANKFHFDYGELAYECLDELHWNRTRDEYLHGSTVNVSFYENLSVVKNSVNRIPEAVQFANYSFIHN